MSALLPGRRDRPPELARGRLGLGARSRANRRAIWFRRAAAPGLLMGSGPEAASAPPQARSPDRSRLPKSTGRRSNGTVGGNSSVGLLRRSPLCPYNKRQVCGESAPSSRAKGRDLVQSPPAGSFHLSPAGRGRFATANRVRGAGLTRDCKPSPGGAALTASLLPLAPRRAGKGV